MLRTQRHPTAHNATHQRATPPIHPVDFQLVRRLRKQREQEALAAAARVDGSSSGGSRGGRGSVLVVQSAPQLALGSGHV